MLVGSNYWPGAGPRYGKLSTRLSSKIIAMQLPNQLSNLSYLEYSVGQGAVIPKCALRSIERRV